MPPKVTPAEAMAEHGNLQLTPKETQMLQTVMSLMPDVPDVDFNVVAELVGQKYAKNAKSACKKLFDKIRASNPAAVEAASSAVKEPAARAKNTRKTPAKEKAESDEGDAQQGETEPDAAPAKKGKTVAKKPAAKMAVGKTAAPKKAAVSKAKLAPKRQMPKKGPAKTSVKKAEDEPAADDIEHTEDNDADEEGSNTGDAEIEPEVKDGGDDDTIMENNENEKNGKFTQTTTSTVLSENDAEYHEIKTLIINGQTVYYDGLDIENARMSDMSMESYLRWRELNFYPRPEFDLKVKNSKLIAATQNDWKK